MQYCKSNRRRYDEREEETGFSGRRLPNQYIMYPRQQKPDPVKADKLITCNKHLQKCINSWSLNTSTPCYHCKNSVHQNSRYDTDQSDTRGLYETASSSNSESYINTLYTVPKQSKKSSKCCPIHKKHKKDCPVTIAQMKCRPVSSSSILDLLKVIKEDCKCRQRDNKPDTESTDIVKQHSINNPDCAVVTKDSFCRMIAPFINDINTDFATVIVGPKEQMNTIDIKIRKQKAIEQNEQERDTKQLEKQIESAQDKLSCICKPSDGAPCSCSSESTQLPQQKDDPQKSSQSPAKASEIVPANDCNCSLGAVNNKKTSKSYVEDTQPILKNGDKFIENRSRRKSEKERQIANTKVYALEQVNYSPWRQKYDKKTLSDIAECNEHGRNSTTCNHMRKKVNKLTMQNVLNCDNKIEEKKTVDSKNEKSSLLSDMTDNLRTNLCKILEHAILKVSKKVEKNDLNNKIYKSVIEGVPNKGNVEVIGDSKVNDEFTDKLRGTSTQSPKPKAQKNVLYKSKHASRGDMEIIACPMSTRLESKEDRALPNNFVICQHKNSIARQVRKMRDYGEIVRKTNQKYYLPNANNISLNQESVRSQKQLSITAKSPNDMKINNYKKRSHSAGKTITTRANIAATSKPFGGH